MICTDIFLTNVIFIDFHPPNFVIKNLLERTSKFLCILLRKKNPHICLLTLDLLVSVNKDDAEGCGFEPATAGDCHIIPLTDVIDVDRDAGISPNAVFLHQRDKLRFC